MVYQVAWSENSKARLKKLGKAVAKRVIGKVESITRDPFRYVKKLSGSDLYRLRVGDYRVIMSIERGRMTVFVVDVGHRKGVYRKR
jgi:mRNA interferase RelE/StbE